MNQSQRNQWHALVIGLALYAVIVVVMCLTVNSPMWQ
jgi:hypothetical protein